MANLLTLQAEPRASFRIGDRIEQPARVVLAKGGGSVVPAPMLWPAGVEVIEQYHVAVSPAPDIDLHIVPNAVLAGGGAMPRIGDAYLYSPQFFPYYIEQFIAQDIQREYWAHPEGTTPLSLPAGIAVIHQNIVFGHWLLEMFPKLLVLKSMAPHLAKAPIILPSTAPAYIKEIIGEVLGDWPLLIYDRFAQHVEVKALILPSMTHDGYQFHPRARGLIKQHQRWAWRSPDGGWLDRLRSARDFRKDRSGERLFVSRRGVTSAIRNLANANDLEAIAVDLGLRPIQPETMSWREQVRAFSKARLIVGEFGSAMHNALFAPPGARIVCLNWLNEVQSRIANFRSQQVGYVLPDDGQPRLYTLDGDPADYRIDPDRFRRAVRTAMA